MYIGLQRVTRGYTELQGFTWGLKGLKGAYKGLQEVSRGYRGYLGLQKVTWGLQRVTYGYKGFQRVTGGSNGLRGVRGGYRE